MDSLGPCYLFPSVGDLLCVYLCLQVRVHLVLSYLDHSVNGLLLEFPRTQLTDLSLPERVNWCIKKDIPHPKQSLLSAADKKGQQACSLQGRSE